MAQPRSEGEDANGHLIGHSMERIEDLALLTGRAMFMDDLPVGPATLYAAFVRSPHAHATVNGIDPERALGVEGVEAVITGADLAARTRPFTVGVKAAMEHYALAVDRARYQGEPVAIVLAETPYVAEDGAALVAVDYTPLPAVVSPDAALAEGAPLLHEGLTSNTIADRSFVYGDPAAAFKSAAHTIAVDVRYPRNSVTPVECYGVIAQYDAAEERYEVASNFQGPFALHPVMALALQVPGNRLRLSSAPNSGGSFGTKQGVFTAIVGLCVAAQMTGRPVKWTEDRLEHLMAATSATNRITSLKAAVESDGKILALDWDQIDDCGAYLRAPEPATLYRMHGNMTGAYAIEHLAMRNRNVLTNKTPSGLVRGFGGPQVYFALERLIDKIALKLDVDPLELRRRNLIAPDQFPYRTASGGLYDSGDYHQALQRLEEKGHLAGLKDRARKAREQGRLYGIGFAAVVEPSISNMGYITTVLTAEERERAGPKGGALATATVAVDALGAVSVHASSVPQGQGHRTVLAQVVASALGLKMRDVAVNTELDTGRDAWSVASGNYSSRFSGAVAGTAHLAAERLKERLAGIAAPDLGCEPAEVRFAGGAVFSRDEPERKVPFRRLAATSHWAQATLPQGADPVVRETVFWSPDVLTPPNAADEINSSAAHGFVFDACGVDIDPATGQVRIDKYVSVHDAGTLLNPALADGQITGGFSNAVGAALYEHFTYGEDGSFQSGTFADYSVPTATEVPDIDIVHLETPSPITPLGAKGVGEGNCMSTPVCIANAVADALGTEDVELPLTPARVLALMALKEPPPPERQSQAIALSLSRTDFTVTGEGSVLLSASPEDLWEGLTRPERLKGIIPGCRSLQEVAPGAFEGEVELGVGIVKGLFRAEVTLSDLEAPRSLRLRGKAVGPLGASTGEGAVLLAPEGGGTRLTYLYGADLSGKVAAIGARMVQGAGRALIAQFLKKLADHVAPAEARSSGLLAWLKRLLGGRI
ncbi:MAG: molybdopterin cofactor-binding domain-containing protein [Pseudomonadota bacterium]